MMAEEYRLDRPTAMSCPDCGGAMATETRDQVTLYRCHIGHVLTIETLLHAKHHVLEENLAGSLAVMSERAELCRLLAEAARREGRDASRYDAAQAQALERAEALRALLESDWLHPEG